MASTTIRSSDKQNAKQRYHCTAYEHQALSICPQYFNGNHPFPLHRFGLVIQFILNYITSCGLHGSCWKQIISAMNQITTHQNKARSLSPDNNAIRNDSTSLKNKKKKRKHSYSSEDMDTFDPFSFCCFWHPFYSKYSHHSHESHQAKKMNAYLLEQFMSYLNDIHQSSSDNPFPLHFYLIDKRIERQRYLSLKFLQILFSQNTKLKQTERLKKRAVRNKKWMIAVTMMMETY